MRKCARFEKVSLEQFKKDFKEIFPLQDEKIEKIYDEIKLPKRATKCSAGYDFYLPFGIELAPKQTIKIPTGIRCFMEDDIVLSLYPRSSLGFKFKMQLNNTVGIIDADYYGAKNEGHIQIKITNDSNEDKRIALSTGDAFAQGIFSQFLVTYDDDATNERTGGFGSTNKQ
ncbi:MAG: deoxyuridine 5'-triphosphate nucleotidohydrolase [Christensenellales bacterium]